MQTGWRTRRVGVCVPTLLDDVWTFEVRAKRQQLALGTAYAQVSGELKISVPLGTKLSRMRALFTIQRSFRCP